MQTIYDWLIEYKKSILIGCLSAAGFLWTISPFETFFFLLIISFILYSIHTKERLNAKVFMGILVVTTALLIFLGIRIFVMKSAANAIEQYALQCEALRVDLTDGTIPFEGQSAIMVSEKPAGVYQFVKICDLCCHVNEELRIGYKWISLGAVLCLFLWIQIDSLNRKIFQK